MEYLIGLLFLKSYEIILKNRTNYLLSMEFNDMT